MGTQTGWKHCFLCQALAFSGHFDNSKLRCLGTGKDHDFSNSSDYTLIQNEDKGAGWQDNWKYCNKCQVLSFAGHPDHPGNCASGSFHDHTDSGNYTLIHNNDSEDGQEGWRWCKKCESLFFAETPNTQGICPAGLGHDASESGKYKVVR